MKPVTIVTLRKRPQFMHVASQGQKCVVTSCVIQVGKQKYPSDCAGLGFTATKKLGGAVVRNRVKRRLRAAAREVFPEYALAGHDYVVIGRNTSCDCAFTDITRDMAYALKRFAREQGDAHA